jgi:NADPH-dependent ferric siderophore reductase
VKPTLTAPEFDAFWAPRSTGVECRVMVTLSPGANPPPVAVSVLPAATVKHHLEHIYRKMGVRGRVQATAMALSMVAHQPSVASC